VEGFLDECAAALQFPPHFGGNWDALNDCLGDLSWLRAEGLVLCLRDAGHVLSAAALDQLTTLSAVLASAAQAWNQPGSRKRSKRPFHVVLHAIPGEEKALEARWQAAGAGWNRLA
jgi:hypothetical protein